MKRKPKGFHYKLEDPTKAKWCISQHLEGQIASKTFPCYTYLTGFMKI